MADSEQKLELEKDEIELNGDNGPQLEETHSIRNEKTPQEVDGNAIPISETFYITEPIKSGKKKDYGEMDESGSRASYESNLLELERELSEIILTSIRSQQDTTKKTSDVGINSCRRSESTTSAIHSGDESMFEEEEEINIELPGSRISPREETLNSHDASEFQKAVIQRIKTKFHNYKLAQCDSALDDQSCELTSSSDEYIKTVVQMPIEADNSPNSDYNQSADNYSEQNLDYERSLIYEELLSKGFMKIEPFNVSEATKNFSDNLGLHIKKKQKSVLNAVKLAEEEASRYDFIHETSHAVNYDHVRNVNMSKFNAEYDPHFKQVVAMNQSFVHTPLEVYDQSSEVLNNVKYTKMIDKVWDANRLEDPSLIWQHFAMLSTGVFRMHPDERVVKDIKWTKRLDFVWNKVYHKNTENTTLHRFYFGTTNGVFRFWPGASFPKQILIMIDASGSMHGQSLKLAKSAVERLVDTLGQNDFVAVGQFPGVYSEDPDLQKGIDKNELIQPHLLVDEPSKRGNNNETCFSTFVQANKRNKQRLFAQLGKVVAKNMANFDEAVKFGVKMFKDFALEPSEQKEKLCNKILIILTDDGAQFSQQAGEALNKDLRLFVYSLGDQAGDKKSLLKFCCDHKGLYQHIPAVGAVTNIIQDVTVVLSRSMANANLLRNISFEVWHNIYLDSFVIYPLPLYVMCAMLFM
ncbi:hypothetical protein Ciccas_005733 [Cichlidogyrus casuarinus]|uniref:VWFA domain-containing protein n=1 Tax=Cichlidogyrus casuarinus TaxID=1844966 RepID=A0ABD2Q7U6_9PLAT